MSLVFAFGLSVPADDGIRYPADIKVCQLRIHREADDLCAYFLRVPQTACAFDEPSLVSRLQMNRHRVVDEGADRVGLRKSRSARHAPAPHHILVEHGLDSLCRPGKTSGVAERASW